LGCVLRAFGAEFEPDVFLKGSTLIATKVWRKGDTRLRDGRKGAAVQVTAGINVGISDADLGDLRQQVQDAIGFLQSNREELVRLTSFPGVEDVWLDFGIAWRQDVVTQTDSLSPNLVRLAGELGLGVEISHYPVSDEAEPAQSR
jgi:hypothetical protein